MVESRYSHKLAKSTLLISKKRLDVLILNGACLNAVVLTSINPVKSYPWSYVIILLFLVIRQYMNCLL